MQRILCFAGAALLLAGCASAPDPLTEYLREYYKLRSAASSDEERAKIDAAHERFMRDLAIMRALQAPPGGPTNCYTTTVPLGDVGWTWTRCR